MKKKTLVNGAITTEELRNNEIKELKDMLIQLRDSLLSKAVERKQDGEYEISRDNLADETDLASVETDQDVVMRLAEYDMHKLNLVDRAIRKIDANDGTYGLCEATGEPIGFKRLRVQPWVLYCLKYQEDLERGKV
jgi:DnaK suppressor protein